MPDIRRIAGNIILIAVFLSLAAVIIMPIAAEMQFNSAQRSAANCQWNDAEDGFNNAIKMDPFNSGYPGGYAESLKLKSGNQDDKTSPLLNAEKLYNRALELNPGQAEYWLGLGQVRISLGKPEAALDNFKTALQKDPNGFNISYPIGYAGITVWKSLNKEEREFILARLKYSLKLRPSYSKYIYPKLWNETMDLNLLRNIEPPSDEPNWYISRLERLEMIRQTARRTLNVAKVVIESDWQGRAYDKKHAYVNGNMCWAGTVDAAIIMPHGKATVRIQAKGSPADNVYPYMKVELDGKEIGAVIVDSSEWKQYDFKVNTDDGVKVLSVTFVNDGRNPTKGEDRNLYIGRAEAI